MNYFMGNSLWRLVSQSDTVSKAVLIILLLLSIVCWTIFLFKIIVLHLKCKQLAQAHHELESVRTVDQLLIVASKQHGTIAGYYLSRIMVFLKILLESRTDHMQKGILQESEWDVLQRQIAQALDIVMSYEESYVSWLSTSAAVAPLLGLFGTIWGLVHAFMSISELQTADIATVAPGIAEALITTLAGLMLAIPALVMFNIVQRYLRTMEDHLHYIEDHVTFVLQKMVQDTK
ncbi:MAG TPA: MotA/TolQ/ExbB proton channel family protein [Candidatus Babeliales bacterium]|jgi:biopolymer transport protein TolQ|nr:MotA/TolQ/ExbB proton channel family protein [Candidatus Babeliales bacterium]